MVNDADGVIYVKLTVKIVNYAVNCQSLVTVTSFKPPLFTVPFLNDAVCAQHWARMKPDSECDLAVLFRGYTQPGGVLPSSNGKRANRTGETVFMQSTPS